ncbi:class I SAM-dependent methyltransferase [Lysobacter claricitrinus]|uniref:class I SAM-dependent methyltransferase n=1 Tax=Lysobacter claricitrinus TaxID=3367728 RepID=UPI0038B27951
MKSLISAVQDGDAHRVSSLFQCSQQDVERWNDEWLSYLSREWQLQLTPYTELRDHPPLPADPLDLISLSLEPGWNLALYCDADALQGRHVMELGCGCGNLGKQLGRYVASYLGVDFSTMALQVARLVSPSNCTYVHVGDHRSLESHVGTVDTVVGRYFWIHQNFELGRQNLTFLERFLRPGGRLYADFFWPDPEAEHYVVLSPTDSLSKTFPSAMFRYTLDDVRELIEGSRFRIVRQAECRTMERRYVLLERF